MFDYDPWVDLNDDGKIDGKDIANVAARFGTLGTPINKTALLLEILSRIDQLNSTIIEQQNTINNLNTTINYLSGTAIRFLYSNGNWADLVIGSISGSPLTTGWVTAKSLTIPAGTLLNRTVLIMLSWMAYQYMLGYPGPAFLGFGRLTVNEAVIDSWDLDMYQSSDPTFEVWNTVNDVKKIENIDNSVEVVINLDFKLDSYSPWPQTYARVVSTEFRVFG